MTINRLKALRRRSVSGPGAEQQIGDNRHPLTKSAPAFPIGLQDAPIRWHGRMSQFEICPNGWLSRAQLTSMRANSFPAIVSVSGPVPTPKALQSSSMRWQAISIAASGSEPSTHTGGESAAWPGGSFFEAAP